MTRRNWITALWIAAPSLVALAFVVWLRIDCLEPADFFRLRREPPLVLRWDEFFAIGDQPAFFCARLLDLVSWSLPFSSLAATRFLVFGAALGFCLWLVRFAADPLPGTPGARGRWLVCTAVGLLSAAWIFSPAFGTNWLFGTRLRMLLPPILFLCGLRLLRRPGRGRLALAQLCALAAVFSEHAGIVVWIALTPMVWLHARRGASGAPWFEVARWVLLGNVATLLCHVALRSGMSGEVGILGAAQNDPGYLARYLLSVVGDLAPRLLDGPRAVHVQAGVLSGAFAALTGLVALRARREELLVASLPFWCCGAFALGVAVQLVDRHVSSVLTPPFLREFLWPGFLLVLGLGGMLFVQLPRVARVVLPFAALWLLGSAAADWHRGFEHLKVAHVASSSRVAAVALVPAGVPLPTGFHAAVSPGDAESLRDRGWLTDLPSFSTAQLEQRIRSARLPANPKVESGRLLRVARGEAEGVAVARFLVPPPSLVLLTRQRPGAAERAFQLVEPNVFTGDGKRLPWRVAFPDAALFQPGEVVRAVGYHLDTGELVRFSGAFRWTENGFEPEAGG